MPPDNVDTAHSCLSTRPKSRSALASACGRDPGIRRKTPHYRRSSRHDHKIYTKIWHDLISPSSQKRKLKPPPVDKPTFIWQLPQSTSVLPISPASRRRTGSLLLCRYAVGNSGRKNIVFNSNTECLGVQQVYGGSPVAGMSGFGRQPIAARQQNHASQSEHRSRSGPPLALSADTRTFSPQSSGFVFSTCWRYSHDCSFPRSPLMHPPGETQGCFTT